MKWSLKIGRIAGVDLYVHATFLILLVWLAASQAMEGQSAKAILGGIAFVLLIFAIIILHELGHALAARRYGITTRDITLLPIGGVARLEKMPHDPREELVVAFAGPLVNVVIAASLFLGIAITIGPLGIFDISRAGSDLPVKLFWVNVALVGFNLLPAFPMDGGRVLRALLALRLSRERATEIAVNIGHAMALMFGFVGLMGWASPFLVFIALFVWIGADAELQQVRVQAYLRGIPVREVMATRFDTIQSDDLLSEVGKKLVPGFQSDFPVVEDGRLLGFLSLDDVLRGIAEGGSGAVARSSVQRQFETASPHEPLDEVMARWQPGAGSALAVMEGARLVGIVTAANIGEHVMIRSALGRRAPAGYSASDQAE